MATKEKQSAEARNLRESVKVLAHGKNIVKITIGEIDFFVSAEMPNWFSVDIKGHESVWGIVGENTASISTFIREPDNKLTVQNHHFKPIKENKE